MTSQNGTADKIREYILQHGTATPAKVAEAYGLGARQVSDAMRKMRADGRLVKVGLDRTPAGQPAVISKLGRDPLPVAARASAGGQARAKLTFASRPKVQSVVKRRPEPRETCLEGRETSQSGYQTVEDYLAAGGRIDVLPSSYVPRTGYPPPFFGRY